MPDPTSNGMQCHEFDSLVSDALDGVLTGAQLDAFHTHARTCSACGPLLANVTAGRNWLKDLTEVEPPVSLVTNILASTTGVDTQRLRANVPASQPGASWLEKLQASASQALQPIWGTVRQPRFAMSFGMAFFSLSVALSMLGVKPADLRQLSLRPTVLRHTYYNTQARVVRYYENIRLVYEVESRVRELKRTVAPAAEPAPEKNNDKKDHKNDTTEQPDQKQERNYSQTENHLTLACAPLGHSVNDLSRNDSSINDLSINDPSVVSVSTYRRFV
ncbi:MAG: zf-HC2 domain-containing protein [Candidatus Sulfotelmatobacter sp.]